MKVFLKLCSKIIPMFFVFRFVILFFLLVHQRKKLTKGVSVIGNVYWQRSCTEIKLDLVVAGLSYCGCWARFKKIFNFNHLQHSQLQLWFSGYCRYLFLPWPAQSSTEVSNNLFKYNFHNWFELIKPLLDILDCCVIKFFSFKIANQISYSSFPQLFQSKIVLKFCALSRLSFYSVVGSNFPKEVWVNLVIYSKASHNF